MAIFNLNRMPVRGTKQALVSLFRGILSLCAQFFMVRMPSDIDAFILSRARR